MSLKAVGATALTKSSNIWHRASLAGILANWASKRWLILVSNVAGVLEPDARRDEYT
jgi:hypothetical protein